MREWDMPKQRKNGRRKPENYDMACVTIFALVIGITISCFIFWAYTDSMRAVDEMIKEHNEQTEMLKNALPDANDVPYSESASASSKSVKKYQMPLYLQTDESWRNVPYGNNTIAVSGCGLTCAAMTIEWFTGERCTPFDLVYQVGNHCMVYADDGTLVNDMELFGNYVSDEYGFKVSEQTWNIKAALAAVNNDYSQTVVWAGVDGELGNEWYDGHIVLIWRVTDEHVYIRDPYSQENSETAFPISDIVNNDAFTYFYTVEEVIS